MFATIETTTAMETCATTASRGVVTTVSIAASITIDTVITEASAEAVGISLGVVRIGGP